MRSDRLRVFECPAVQQIGGNSSRSKSVAVGGGAKLSLVTAPLDHAEHVLPVHPDIAQFAFLGHAAPQRGAFLVGDAGGTQVGVEIFLRFMYLALSYDHRAIDGVLGNRFLYRTARILEAGFEL